VCGLGDLAADERGLEPQQAERVGGGGLVLVGERGGDVLPELQVAVTVASVGP